MFKVKSPLPIFTLVLFFTGFMTIPNGIASEHKHGSYHNPQQEMLRLDQGQKWPIDASLHTGMSNIKASMEKNISAIHSNKFTVEQYSNLSQEVKVQLVYLFESCKLPAKADEQLHTLLFKVMQGSEEMQSPDKPRAGAIQIIQALQLYPQYFNDRYWQVLEH
jgi:hypothetical protein